MLNSSTVLLYVQAAGSRDQSATVRFYGDTVLHYLLSLEVCPLDIALQSNVPGWMQVDCGSWIRWLMSRIRSCADKLGGSRESDTVHSELPSSTTMTVTAEMLG